MSDENKARALLEQLGQEEAKPREDVEIPVVEFSPINKIASILETNPNLVVTFDDITRRLPNADYTAALLAQHTVQYLGVDDVVKYLGVGDADSVERLVLADIVTALLGERHYKPEEPIRKMLVKVARDIYDDVLEVLGERVYAREKERVQTPKKKELPPPVITPANDPAEIFNYFRGYHFNLVLAATHIAENLSGLEGRLSTLKTVGELNHLVGTSLYLRLIKDKDVKKDILGKVADFRYAAEDVFVYAALKLHEDFFKFMEGYEK